MGEQKLFAERAPGCLRGHLRRDTGQAAVALAIRGAEGKRHEGGMALHDAESELAGHGVAEWRGAHFRNRQPAGGDHQGRAFECPARSLHGEPGADRGCGATRCLAGAGSFHDEAGARRHGNPRHYARGQDAHARCGAFRLQHGDDIAGGTVAEQLPEGLLVEGDAVALHHPEKIARREPGERGLGEVRVAREEVIRRGVPVGEIAAPATGDEDFAPDLRVMLQQDDAPAAPGRLNSAHQAGGTRSDDHSVHCFSRHPLTFWQSGALCWLRMTRKVLIVTGDGGDSYEALYAFQRFQEAHWEPVIASPSRRRLHMVIHDSEPGWDTYVERPGHAVEAHIAITAVSTKEFAAIVILGGRAPEYLRNDASLLSLVREFATQNKCVCAIGHGIQVLVAAGLTSGRTVTGPPHVCVEVERAGGKYSEKPAIRDGRMITAQSWKAHPEFYREVFACLEAPK